MDQVIGFHYTLKNNEGTTLDSSAGQDPLLFLAGKGQIIPGLEKVLTAMNVGDKKVVVVTPEEGYGPVRDDLKSTATKSQFPPEADLKVGTQFMAGEGPGAPVVTVTKIEGEDVYLDANHPMAGVELHFDVEITEKRDATEEEVAHGHAHGAGGHHH